MLFLGNYIVLLKNSFNVDKDSDELTVKIDNLGEYNFFYNLNQRTLYYHSPMKLTFFKKLIFKVVSRNIIIMNNINNGNLTETNISYWRV